METSRCLLMLVYNSILSFLTSSPSSQFPGMFLCHGTHIKFTFICSSSSFKDVRQFRAIFKVRQTELKDLRGAWQSVKIVMSQDLRVISLIRSHTLWIAITSAWYTLQWSGSWNDRYTYLSNQYPSNETYPNTQ